MYIGVCVYVYVCLEISCRSQTTGIGPVSKMCCYKVLKLLPYQFIVLNLGASQLRVDHLNQGQAPK